MKRLFTTEIGRLRVVSMLEGLSFLVLLGVAMPMKYLAHDPSLVRVMGRVHGGLFVLFAIAVAGAATAASWNARRVAVAFVSSMLPFGAFWFERQLREEQRSLEAPPQR